MLAFNEGFESQLRFAGIGYPSLCSLRVVFEILRNVR